MVVILYAGGVHSTVQRHKMGGHRSWFSQILAECLSRWYTYSLLVFTDNTLIWLYDQRWESLSRLAFQRHSTWEKIWRQSIIEASRSHFYFFRDSDHVCEPLFNSLSFHNKPITNDALYTIFCLWLRVGFKEMFPDKHPTMWTQPMAELWYKTFFIFFAFYKNERFDHDTHRAETWHAVGPLIHGVIDSGKGFHATDHLLVLQRAFGLTEMYFTFAYSPVTEGVHVVGILVNLLDTSEQVSFVRVVVDRCTLEISTKI